jgi:hypothetical protein
MIMPLRTTIPVPPPRVGRLVCEPCGPILLKVRLVQEADVNAVLTEELFQFHLSAANSVSVPLSQPQAFPPFVLLGCADILG